MLVSEEVAVCDARGPVGFASATTAAAKVPRLLLSPASSPAWVARSVCSFCQIGICAVAGVRTAATTVGTSIPFPFSSAAALKLTPIISLLALHDRRGLAGRRNVCPRANLLQQFLRLLDAAQLFRARHLQHQGSRLAAPGIPTACLRPGKQSRRLPPYPVAIGLHVPGLRVESEQFVASQFPLLEYFPKQRSGGQAQHEHSSRES